MMKILSAVLFIFGSVSCLSAYSLRKVERQMQINKWTLNGNPVFTDADRDAMIAASVDTGTGTLTVDSFVAETVPAMDAAIFAEIQSEIDAGKRTAQIESVAGQIEKRKTSEYIENQIVEQEELKRMELIKRAKLGKNVDARLIEIDSRIQVFRNRLNP